MKQIGYGYGSEWQLLRFLGHHRDLFENEIRKQLKLKGTSVFKWLDFGFADRGKCISGDAELKGLCFLRELKKNIDLSNYPAGLGRSQSWDAIVIIEDVIYLVEAKARIGELSDKNQHGGKSRDEILKFMRNQLKDFGSTVDIKADKWLGEYYQMANRIAVAAYLNNTGVRSKVLYIYFEDGYYTQDQNLGADMKQFKEAIRKEKEELGISDDSKVSELFCEVFIHANPQK